MKRIERYIYAIKTYLPEEIREDVGKELRANIEDMLPDDYTEEDVYQVLMKLGSPRKLADEYNSQKRYLIGPSYYDKYIAMLKRVIGICIAVTLSISFLVWILEAPIKWYEPKAITDLIGSMVSSGVYGALQAVFWVTLAFIILERTGVEAGYIPFYNKQWSPDDLPEIPVNSRMKISRGETAFTLFSTILFTALIYFRPQLIALYLNVSNDTMDVIPFFDLERLRFFIPIILVFTVVELGMIVWKFITESWNLHLAIANAVYNLGIIILAIIMLKDSSLINAEFISAIADMLKISLDNVSTWIDKSKLIFGLVFMGICGWDGVVNLLRSLGKSSKENVRN